MKKFKTKAEVEWYIQGLRDAKETSESHISMEITRYKDSIPFIDFKKNNKQ